MSRVLGRTDDMLVIRGVNVFPSEIERALLSVPQLAPHYRLVVERPARLDELTVEAELRAGEGGGERLQAHVEERLGRALGLSARVSIGPAGSLPRSEGKALRVVDLRG